MRELTRQVQLQMTIQSHLIFFDETEPECQLQSVFLKASPQTEKTEVELVFLDP